MEGECLGRSISEAKWLHLEGGVIGRPTGTAALRKASLAHSNTAALSTFSEMGS